MTEVIPEDCLDALRGLGFTATEALVYAHLCTNPPATAYRIGKLIGKPTANVYKVVAALADKGAVIVEDGSARRCQAVPLEEVCERLELNLKENSRRANACLAPLRRPAVEDSVYRIETADLVFERARKILGECGKVAIVDAFPRALERLLPELASAIGRGVEVVVEAYAPIEIAGARIAVVPNGERTLALWRSEQLNLAVDGRKHLAALLSPDLTRVYQAVWSSSPYLSCLHHAGRLCENTVVRLLQCRDDPERMAEVLAEHRFFIDGEIPGQQEIVAQMDSIEQPNTRGG